MSSPYYKFDVVYDYILDGSDAQGLYEAKHLDDALDHAKKLISSSEINRVEIQKSLNVY